MHTTTPGSFYVCSGVRTWVFTPVREAEIFTVLNSMYLGDESSNSEACYFWKVIRLLEKIQDKGMKGLQVVMDVGLRR